jgi:hypothetical protein
MNAKTCPITVVLNERERVAKKRLIEGNREKKKLVGFG